MESGRKRAAEPGAQKLGARNHRKKIKSDTENDGKANSNKRTLQSGDSYDESHSDSDSSSRGNASTDPSSTTAIRRPTYWLEMRGIKSSENSTSGKGETSSKKKRLPKVKDEDSELPKASTELLGKKPAAISEKKSKAYVKKAPPSYPAGSEEEGWYLHLLEKGRIKCPKCGQVTRKTVEGLKMHMANCKPEPFHCQHCGKQYHTRSGMKYHIMVMHTKLPVLDDGGNVEGQSKRSQLLYMLRRMGRLMCSNEGCTKRFSSLLGYLYHKKKCGKEDVELVEMELKCHNCGKMYKSQQGLLYHMKAEHIKKAEVDDWTVREPLDLKVEQGSSGDRVRRRSAKVANYHLQEIATEELIKEWPKRKVHADFVPDVRQLKYSRPGLPSFSQEVIRKWRSELKLHRRVRCPNRGCESVYTSVSGLKAHLFSCRKGDFVGGKYKCLLCEREFISESGVKYHINALHFEEWFVVNVKSAKKCESFMYPQMKVEKVEPKEEKLEAPDPVTVPLKPPSPIVIKNERNERMWNPPSDSESDDQESSHSSMDEEEVESVIWRARQPIVKPAALSPVKPRPGLIKAALLKPGFGKTTELKPGLIKAAVLNPGLGNTSELKSGLGQTTTLKPGLIKAAVLKLDRRRK